jgi:pimeloyl-ACP methyl ester carboxylesterase
MNTEILNNLVSQGYICLTFDFRGHGRSDDWGIDVDFSQGADIVIQNIKEYVEIYAKDDMISAVKFLRKHEKVDRNNIALIGGSLGANCAINGCNLKGVKAVVAMSPSTVGILPDLDLKNIFYLVGEYDYISSSGGPSYIEDTKKLFEHSAEPKKLFVLPQESSHGLEYIGKLDISQQIVNWINTRIID